MLPLGVCLASSKPPAAHNPCLAAKNDPTQTHRFSALHRERHTEQEVSWRVALCCMRAAQDTQRQYHCWRDACAETIFEVDRVSPYAMDAMPSH